MKLELAGFSSLANGFLELAGFSSLANGFFVKLVKF